MVVGKREEVGTSYGRPASPVRHTCRMAAVMSPLPLVAVSLESVEFYLVEVNPKSDGQTHPVWIGLF